jgi:enamine deaminase RidA (YjgF/YER057c/UK114 family)
MRREILATPSVHSTRGNFSHAVRFAGPEDISAQCGQVFHKPQSVLDDIGSSLDAIVKLTAYLTSPEHVEAYRVVSCATSS